MTNCLADGVKATRTLAPALMRVRTKSGILYAAMPPVTTTVKFNPLSMVSSAFQLTYSPVKISTTVAFISATVDTRLWRTSAVWISLMAFG